MSEEPSEGPGHWVTGPLTFPDSAVEQLLSGMEFPSSTNIRAFSGIKHATKHKTERSFSISTTLRTWGVDILGFS